MHRITRILSAALFLWLAPLPPATAAASTNLVNGVYVIVNDSVITWQQVQTELSRNLPMLRERFGPRTAELNQALREQERAIVEAMVEQKLILHEFETAGYRLPDTLIDDELQNDIRNRFTDRVTLVKSLQQRGQTWEGFKEEFRERFIVDVMQRQKINSEVIISPYKIERYYRENQEKYAVDPQVKLRMIVVPVTAGMAAAQSKASDILAELNDGKSFEEVARLRSVGAQAGDGGDYGWVTAAEIRREVAERVFDMEPGQTSGIIEAEDALFIVRVDDERDARVRPLGEVREEIEQTLRAEETARIRREWIAKLREKSYIRYF